MTDPTYLTDNIHLIRLAVDSFLERDHINYETRILMENFQGDLEAYLADQEG